MLPSVLLVSLRKTLHFVFISRKRLNEILLKSQYVRHESSILLAYSLLRHRLEINYDSIMQRNNFPFYSFHSWITALAAIFFCSRAASLPRTPFRLGLQLVRNLQISSIQYVYFFFISSYRSKFVCSFNFFYCYSNTNVFLRYYNLIHKRINRPPTNFRQCSRMSIHHTSEKFRLF